ncbi:MAG: glycosyltransferase [Ardenticatenaceae bacterium]|nr:glycosyltransferase [Ardenticatenaceae bacterium]
MLRQVEIAVKHLEDYRPIVESEVIEEILDLAEPLKGSRVVHVNATDYGGGVAEILQALVPLMRDVGLDAHWQVIEGSNEFFNVTKAFHNGLQGMDIPLTQEMKATWIRYNQLNAKKFEGPGNGLWDFAVIHDPQPAGLCQLTRGRPARHWIWRCHIDTSQPNREYWDFLVPYLQLYETGIFTMREYVGPGCEFEKLAIIPPTIDPLSLKNLPMDPAEAADIVRRLGVDPDRPLISQISRFDPWKDPLGVIDTYKQVKQVLPEIQLALVGSMASDDPEGWNYLEKTCRRAGEDPDVCIRHNFNGAGAREVNAFQTHSHVIVQKSTREGFGLVVTEALWKGKPVIGGNVGGIPLQIVHGVSGYLVNSMPETAEVVIDLLQHPSKADAMGRAGREHVRKHFLLTRYLRDYLRLFRDLSTCM